MSEPHHEDPILVHLSYIREKADSIDNRLDAQNGRLRAAENAIAVLRWANYLVGTATLALFVALLRKIIP